MSDYAGWSKEMLEKEISTFAECRDACLRGDWGPDRRHLAEGYARRVDGLVMALNSLKPPPTGGSMTREQIQKAICKADCFHWRVLGNLECEGPCRANEFQLEMRHGHAADNVLDLVAPPTDGTE